MRIESNTEDLERMIEGQKIMAGNDGEAITFSKVRSYIAKKMQADLVLAQEEIPPRRKIPHLYLEAELLYGSANKMSLRRVASNIVENWDNWAMLDAEHEYSRLQIKQNEREQQE